MKHLFNNLSSKEKADILKKHSEGGTNIVIENFNKLISSKLGNVKTILSEQVPTPPTDNTNTNQSQPNSSGNTNQSQSEPVPGDVPPCVMKGDGLPGSGGSIEGPFDKIVSTGSVAPEYQGYTVYKEGRPYCFIKS